MVTTSVIDNITLNVRAFTVESFLSEFCFRRPKKPADRLNKISTNKLIIKIFARDNVIFS